MLKVSKSLLKAVKMPAFDHQPVKYTGKSKAEVLADREKYLNPAIFLYHKNPIMLVEGKMQYVFDENGERFLDCFGGIVTTSVGHSHPKVSEAAKKQHDLIQHTTTIYANPNITEYAEKLLSKFPDYLDTVFFTNSGSEATDLATLMAKVYTGRNDIISLRNCYHGDSFNAMGITSLHTWKYPIPQGAGIHRVLTPDMYNGPFAELSEEEQKEKYLWDLEDCIKHSTSGQIAGMIIEPIQGVGGVVEYPEGYLKEAFEIVRSYGGVAIADEVQTGFGRLGTAKWGFEDQGAEPDIVDMAKSIGNGAPLGAVVCRREIAEAMREATYFNTYGGNPVSMAIGSAVLDVMDEEDLQTNCLERGNELIGGLKKLMDKYEIIGDVRGKGLMIGMELVKDRKTKEPAVEETAKIFDQMKDDFNILVGKGGLYGNVFRIKPPMCITKEDVEYVLYSFDQCLADL